jgi:hypothetical protein
MEEIKENQSGGFVSVTLEESYYKPPMSKMYLVYALIACLLFDVSTILKGALSENILVTNFSLATALLTCGITFIIYKKIMARKKGAAFIMPWYRRDPFQQKKQVPLMNEDIKASQIMNTSSNNQMSSQNGIV